MTAQVANHQVPDRRRWAGTSESLWSPPAPPWPPQAKCPGPRHAATSDPQVGDPAASGQPVPGLRLPTSAVVPPGAQVEPLVLQAVPAAPCLGTGHRRAQPGSVLSAAPFRRSQTWGSLP